MTEKFLPLAAMEKILKRNGADRVSDNSKVAMREVIEEKASKIANRAVKFAIHAGRKTIKAEDIKLASKEQ